MLILATVAINAAISGDGLFARARKAVDETTIATYEENIEMAKMLALLDKQEKGGGGITVNELIDKLVEQGFVKEGNVTRPTEEDKNGYVEKDGLIFELKKDDNGDIKVEYVGEADNIIPTIKIALSSETATSKVTVSVTGKEQINGLASIEQKGGDKKTYNELVKEKTEEFEITENGDYTFIVTSKKGKTAEETIKIGNIDKEAPTGEHILNPEEGSWGKTVEITVTGKDTNGIKQITDPDGKVSIGEKCTYTAKENKEYKFLIKDTLDNEAEYKVQVNNVDIVEPSATHTISPEKGEYGETVTITVMGEDSQSGVKQITDPDGKVCTGETCTYAAKENKTYTFVIEDNVGNKKNYDVAIENVLIPVQSITLNTQSLSLGEEESDTLTATVQPDNATYKTVTWRSEDSQTATVEDHKDGTATVTGVKAGSTNIVAEAGGQSVNCKVDVKANMVASWVEQGTRKAPIPSGYVASQIPGEDTIEDGLVIYEGEDPVTGEKDGAEHQTAMKTRNQYVWIPVDDINDMVMCQIRGGASCRMTLKDNTLYCTTHSTATELAGKLYATDKGNNFDKNLSGQVFAGFREPVAIEGSSSSSSRYDDAPENYHGYGNSKGFANHLQEEFNNMANSVAKYKGFYISRYEIQKGDTNGIASKKEVPVLNDKTANGWYGLYTAIEKSTSPESTVQQMIWGSQYDQVMKFVDEKNGYKVTEANEARHDSTGYKNSGNNTNDIACNIYDLEGNYYEWTEEASGDVFRVTRGRPLR